MTEISGKATLPDIAPGHWDTSAGRAMAETYLGKDRHWGSGPLSDMALANRLFMAGRDDIDLICWQSSAKDRIRWLSAQLAARDISIEALEARVRDLSEALGLMLSGDVDVSGTALIYHDLTDVVTTAQAALAGTPSSTEEG